MDNKQHISASLETGNSQGGLSPKNMADEEAFLSQIQ